MARGVSRFRNTMGRTEVQPYTVLTLTDESKPSPTKPRMQHWALQASRVTCHGPNARRSPASVLLSPPLLFDSIVKPRQLTIPLLSFAAKVCSFGLKLPVPLAIKRRMVWDCEGEFR